jgi:acetolactate synthase regulatory subunit
MIELTVDGKRSIAIVTEKDDKLYTILWLGPGS